MKQYIVEVIVEVEDNYLENTSSPMTPEEYIEAELKGVSHAHLTIPTVDITARFYTRDAFIEEFITNIQQCYEQGDSFTPMQGCVEGEWFSMFQNEHYIQVTTFASQGDYLNDDSDDGGGGIAFYTKVKDYTVEKYKLQAEFALELIGLPEEAGEL